MASTTQIAVVKKKSKYIKQLAEDPTDITKALRAAGLPLSLAKEAEVWDETLLIRREVREALNVAGVTAQWIADKLYAAGESGSIRAVEFAAKLRGYCDPPKSANDSPNRLSSDPRERELEKRNRILTLIGISSYPQVREEEIIPGGEGTGDEGENQGDPLIEMGTGQGGGTCAGEEVAGSKGEIAIDVGREKGKVGTPPQYLQGDTPPSYYPDDIEGGD